MFFICFLNTTSSLNPQKILIKNQRAKIVFFYFKKKFF